MAGWGAGQKIVQGGSPFQEKRYYEGPVGRVDARTVTDDIEIWTGMTAALAEAKSIALIATTGYTSAPWTRVVGGQYMVTATKRTYGDWVQISP